MAEPKVLGGYDAIVGFRDSYLELFPERCQSCSRVDGIATRLAVRATGGKISVDEAMQTAQTLAADTELNCPNGLHTDFGRVGSAVCGYQDLIVREN